MSQNPYSGTGMNAGGPSGGFEQYAAEPRTSLLAVASLVFGILSLVTCCVGGVMGVPAAACGIASLLVMNAKRGELSGRGMAIGGVVMGTIGLFINIVIFVGASMYVNQVSSMASTSMNGIEILDVRPMQSFLNPKAAARLDEPKMIAFRKAYQDKLGKFKKADTNLIEYGRRAWDTYSGHTKAIERLMESRQGAPIPAVGVFEKGTATIWVIGPQQMKVDKKGNVFLDLAIVPPGEDPIFLLGDETPATAPATGTAPAPTANPDPSGSGTPAPQTPPPAAPTAPTTPTGG